MAAQIKVPPVGESITEVIIGQWLVAAGDSVRKDQPLAVLETDKVNIEVPAPATGVLSKILKDTNASAAIDEVIGLIEEGAVADKAATGQGDAGRADAGKADAGRADAGRADAGSADAGRADAGQPAAAPHAPAGQAAFVMPAAARLAAAHQADPHSMQAHGPGGRLLKEDVQRSLDQAAAAPAARPAPAGAPAAGSGERLVPMSPMRRRIAERLVQAQQTAAILTTFNEIDMGEVMALRKRVQDAFVKRHGVKLGFMSFFVKAAIEALKAYPEVNAAIRGTDVVYHDSYDIGVAVGGEKGLVVPVLRQAQQLSFAGIEQTISDFGARAGKGKIRLEEMQGGTFTISNGGVYGSLMSTPILNPPQSGILGMHNIVERPIGVQGTIVLRPMMYVALSYDHRIVDGRGAVSFLRRIKECVEEPSRMLLEI